jgi:hypothetical protein
MEYLSLLNLPFFAKCNGLLYIDDAKADAKYLSTLVNHPDPFVWIIDKTGTVLNPFNGNENPFAEHYLCSNSCRVFLITIDDDDVSVKSISPDQARRHMN